MCEPNHYQCLACRRMGGLGTERGAETKGSRRQDGRKEQRLGYVHLSFLPVPAPSFSERAQPLRSLPPRAFPWGFIQQETDLWLREGWPLRVVCTHLKFPNLLLSVHIIHHHQVTIDHRL